MLELQSRPPEAMTLEDLHAAGEYFMQAIDIDPNQVQPYVLLASLFLVAGNRQLADKYITLAERIRPDFPKLLELKEHMMTPPSLLRQQQKKTAGSPLPVAQIQRIRPLGSPAPKDDLFRFPEKSH